MQMKAQPIARNTGLLYFSLLLACIYCGLLYFIGGLFGMHSLDGSLGVVLGLFICSHPAANAVDALFYERGTLQRFAAGWAGIHWLMLNLLTLGMGWVVIVLGAIQLAAR